MDRSEHRARLMLVACGILCVVLPLFLMVVVAAEPEEIDVDPVSLVVSEPDGSATFTLRLSTIPTSAVTIHLSTSNAECSVLPSSIILTSENWEAGASGTVTAVDDRIDDDQQTCIVQTAEAVSDDSLYNGLDPADVTVTVEDDDKAYVSISPTNVSVIEGGTTDTYQVVLTSQPRHPVIVSIATDDQATTSRALLVFHDGNWYARQTVIVAAVDDGLVEGPHTGTITHTISSNDAKYAALDPDNINVTIQDNDLASITVDPTNLTVAEPDGLAHFTISLTAEPMFSVTVPLSTSNSQCNVTPTLAVLDAGSWLRGAEFTVSANDDAIDDGEQPCVVHTGQATSQDASYAGQDPPDVSVTVEDDDEAGITVEPTSLTVSEPSDSASFTITLTSEPTSAVTIPLSASNGECSILPTAAQLSSGNWHSDVRMTVTAVDDFSVDGAQICIIQLAPALSADEKYNGLKAADVTVTVQDDDRLQQAFLPVAVRKWPPLPQSPALQPIDNPGGLGSYTVNWSPAAGAEIYLLEQAGDSAFSDAVPVYQGPLTSYTAAGQSPTRYHYRVKSRNAWGDSGWSGPEQVDVLWEKEPNDLPPGQANGPLLSGPVYHGAFPVASDVYDHYYFDLSGGQVVEIWLRNIPAGSDYDLILRDASLSPVAYSINPGNINEQVVTGALPSGRYYIQVYRRSLGSNPQPYDLQLRYE